MTIDTSSTMQRVRGDIDDLVGGSAPPDRGDVARRLEEAVARGQKSKYGGTATADDISGIHAGVTVSWLAQAFRMDPKTVKLKLAKCPVLKAHQRGYIYEFRVAVGYLVTPQIDIDEYMQNAKVKDLPTRLQAEYWQAKRAQQIWEREAGSLWRTEDVLRVLGEVFGVLKSTMQLWVEDIERETLMSPEQRELLTHRVDNLQAQIYSKLVALPEQGRTPSSIEDATAEDDFADLI